MPSSEYSGFYKLGVRQRIEFVKKFSNITDNEAELLVATGSLPIEQADRMIENVVGAFPVPLGVAVNFLINGKDYLIPMAIEEPSVVAAASHAAKLARARGGFMASSTSPIMIGQIQIVDVSDPEGVAKRIEEAKNEIISKANQQDATLVKLGGGAKDLQVKTLKTIVGPMVIAEILVDCRDAMGANAVNTMAEAVAPFVERVSGGRVHLRIISNLASRRLSRAEAVFDRDAIGGEDVVDGIVSAYAFAAADPYRCATHNKGIMNGVTAVTLATGNDTRAVEAGAHAYAARSGQYSPLTEWRKNSEGDLVGTIEIPTAVGLIGGATAVHPIAKLAVKILDVKTATELGDVMASVGLAQNFAALRALATEGIQRGHMALHARNIAMTAGAAGDLVDRIAERMVQERRVKLERAKELLEEFRRPRA